MNTNQHHTSNLISTVTSNRMLDNAFNTVYKQREKDDPHSDIWSLSRHWPTIRAHLRTQLLSGASMLSPVFVFRTKKGYFSRFSAQDAVVLKALTICLTSHVVDQTVPTCHHLQGRGGLKGAVRRVGNHLKEYHFVIKSDVHQFYESMKHQQVMAHCQTLVMQGLKFKLALNKTLIGRIQKGFDFLGYRFNHQGIIDLAKKTIQNFIERITTL